VALAEEQHACADETKAPEQALPPCEARPRMSSTGGSPRWIVLTEDDRAFLPRVIAEFDAFAAIQGDDADSRTVRIRPGAPSESLECLR